MQIIKNVISGLKTQFVLIIMGAILPFFILSIYNIRHMTQMESRNAEVTAQEQAYIAARDFEVILQNARHLLYTAASDTDLVVDPDYCQSYAEIVPRREPTIDNFVVIGTDGELLCSSKPVIVPGKLDASDWFQRILYGQELSITPVNDVWNDAGVYSTVATAHFDDIGLTDGIIVALMDQSWIDTVRDRIDLPKNSTVSIISPDGLYRYRDPFSDEYLNAKAPEEFSHEISEGVLKGSFTSTGLDGVERFYGYTRLDPMYGGAYVNIGIPKEKALESVRNLLFQNIIINLLVVIIAIAFTTSFAGSRILSVVDRLVETSKKLAGGDLNAQTGLLNTGGELGFLARIFDDTIRKLKNKDEEREKALDEATRERRYFELLVESSPDAITIWDTEKNTRKVNPAFVDLFGYTDEDLKTTKLDDLINTPESLDQGLQLTQQVTNGDRIRIISRRKRKDGQLLDVEISAVPIIINGKQLGDFAIYHDITALIEAKRTAEASARAKADFLANMSHEIRTPLNAVIGMTNLLMDTRLDSTQYDFVETIRTSGEDLLTIINDILDFSKIEAGKLDIESTPFDLADCVESALQLLAPRASDKGLEMLYLINQNAPAAVIGDPTRLRQILVNLLGNAVKFTEKGEIFLSVDASQLDETMYELRFSVADTGIGISEESRSRIFQSFSQADTSTTRKFGGTGLGLSISKRLAESMGGTMWYESEPGKGSTFFFTVQAEITEAIHKKVVPDCLSLSQGKNVLVVDDNNRNRLILEKQLESWKMNCIPASSGFQALEILRRIPNIDAAIVDMQMPEMDGKMLAKSIKEMQTYRKMPIVLLSSIGQPEKGEGSRLFSARLSKPVRPSLLLETLLSLFANRPIVVRDSQQLSSEIDQNMGIAHPLRILLADDNVVNQKVAIRMLERIGYRADLAANGIEVLQAVERQTYDLILMDVQMPEMDGVEASRLIHKRIPKDRLPRIIAMTAHALQGDRERFLADGMDDYLSKPVQMKELIRAIQGTTTLSNDSRDNKEAESTTPDDHILWETLDSYYRVMGDDTNAFLAELIGTFLPNTQKLIDDLNKSLEGNDLATFHRSAHTLKSSSASLGAMRLSELAKNLEFESADSFPENSGDQVKILQVEFELIKPEYQKFLDEKKNR